MLFALPRTIRLVLAVGIGIIALLVLNNANRLLGFERASPTSQQFQYVSPTENQDGETLAGSPVHVSDIAGVPHDQASASLEPAPCQALEGADDVLVILRTGASEIEDRVPVHLETTFRCYSKPLIFSDFDEDSFYGYKVHNVLQYQAEDVVEGNEDFDYYRKLQQYGRISLHQDELSGKKIDEGDGLGKGDNLGWRLDKWKFLPMMNMTFNLEPSKKWYVFVEPDSYLVWSNLLQWLQEVDASKPWYLGADVMIGDDVFAHGGSVWVLSRPALERVAQIYNEKTSQWNELLAWEYWAGDCILGRALNDSGVPLTPAFPMLQGNSPSLVDFDSAEAWCTPAISFHHVRDDEVRALWQFEQDWIRLVRGLQPLQDVGALSAVRDHPRLLHKDFFNHFIMPNITTERQGWDNHADMLMEETESATMNDCRELCEYNEGCKLFSVGPFGCSISFESKIGQPRDDMQSGWLVDRIHGWMDEIGTCSDMGGWSAP